MLFVSHFSQSLLIVSNSSPLPNTSHSNSSSSPAQSFSSRVFFFLWYDLPSYIYHAVHLFLPNFWGFWKFLGFFKIDKVFANFLGWFCLNNLQCSCIASHLHFNNVSCIINVCLLCWNHVCWQDWIGLSPWCFYYCMSHARAFFMHTYNFILYLIDIDLCLVLFFLSLSLSLSFYSVSLLYGT